MSNKQNALQVSFVALYQPTALYVGTLGRSPTCLTSCPFVALYVGNLQHKLSRPFVALYFGIPPKSLKLSLACQQPTALRPPKSLTFGALYVRNLQPWKVPKMPHKLSLCSPVCPQPTALAGAKKHHKLSLYGPVCQQPTALGGAKKHHKLSLCSPVCQQPTALGGPQKASQVVLCIPVCRQPTALGGPRNPSQVVPL